MTDSPIITKVGAIVLRHAPDGSYETLICQPNGKGNKPGKPPMGFVRGTRQYLDNDTNHWIDAPRDGEPLPENVQWESVYSTLTSELKQEAGIDPIWLSRQPVYDLGDRPFTSTSKEAYPIHWFAVVLDADGQEHQALHAQFHQIEDSSKTEWVSREQLEKKIEITDIHAERVSPGYGEVMDWAVKLLNTKQVEPIKRLTDLVHYQDPTTHPSR